MILSFVIPSIILCQIIPISSSPIAEPGNTDDVALKETKEPATDQNMLIDYVSTEVGTHKIHNSRATWNDARNICLDEKAQLVIIDSAAEEAMLLKHLKEHGMTTTWVGVHDMFSNKQWTTVTGERLYTGRYVRWRLGEPNGSGTAGEHCVEMHVDGLNDLPCNVEIGFVCEKNNNDSHRILIA